MNRRRWGFDMTRLQDAFRDAAMLGDAVQKAHAKVQADKAGEIAEKALNHSRDIASGVMQPESSSLMPHGAGPGLARQQEIQRKARDRREIETSLYVLIIEHLQRRMDMLNNLIAANAARLAEMERQLTALESHLEALEDGEAALNPDGTLADAYAEEIVRDYEREQDTTVDRMDAGEVRQVYEHYYGVHSELCHINEALRNEHERIRDVLENPEDLSQFIERMDHQEQDQLLDQLESGGAGLEASVDWVLENASATEPANGFSPEPLRNAQATTGSRSLVEEFQISADGSATLCGTDPDEPGTHRRPGVTETLQGCAL